MGVDLNTKVYNSFGYEVLGSDLVNSGKWNYAIYDKTSLSQQQTKDIFGYYQDHSYFNVARGAAGFLGKYKSIETQRKEQKNYRRGPYSNQINFDTRGFDIGRSSGRSFDPFKDLRLNNKQGFFRDKLDVNIQGNKVSYYDQVHKTEYKQAGPAGIFGWTEKAPSDYVKSPSGGVVLRNSSPNRNFHYSTRQVATGQRGEQKSGYILNGAFVPEDIYSQLSETEKLYYGQTFDQAKRLDPTLGTAAEVVDAAYQYRRGRSRKKTGLSAAVGAIAPNILAIAGGAVAGPVGAAVGSGVSTGIQGGSIQDILLDAGKGYLGAQAAGQLNYGAKGTIWGPQAGGVNPLGAEYAAQAGGSNVSFLNKIFQAGSDVFGGISDIFSSGGFDFLGQNLSFSDILGTGLEIYGSRKADKEVQRAQERAASTSDQGSAARTTAGTQLDELIRNPERAKNLPGYEFALSEGEEAVARQNARAGYSRAPKNLIDIFNYSSDFAFKNYKDYGTFLNDVVQGSPQHQAAFQQGAGVTGGYSTISQYGALGELFHGGETVSQAPQDNVFQANSNNGIHSFVDRLRPEDYIK